MKILRMVFILSFILLSAFAFSDPADKDEYEEIFADTDFLQVTPYLENNIESKNTIFCITFQNAWDELKEIMEGPIITITETTLSKNLNDNILSGITENYINLNNFEKKVDVSQTKIKINTLLKEDLKFTEKFDDMGYRDFNNSRKVKYFGFYEGSTYNLRKQVDLLYYSNENEENEFIIELITESNDSELVLAKISPEDTLLQTYMKCENLINNSDTQKLDEEDELFVPCIDFHIKMNFEELLKVIENSPSWYEGTDPWAITEAWQRNRFQLNEVGIELESESEIVCEAMCAPGPFEEVQKPKILNFNEPFLLFMRKKNTEMPYFVLWIQDGYLLVKEK